MNILVHAFDISPTRGSEAAVSWNYVKQMSQSGHRLFVIVGTTTNGKLGDFSQLKDVELPNVEFIRIRPNVLYEISYKIHRKILYKFSRHTRYITFYFWNRHIYKTIRNDRKLLSQIDIVHFVSPVGFHEIGYLYKLKKPCIWGPVGGFTNCRKEFYSHYVCGGGG